MKLKEGPTGEKILRWLGLIFGLFIAGESAALLFGMMGDQAWIMSKNLAFVIVDILTGLMLVFIALAQEDLLKKQYINLGLLGVIVLTHLLRLVEYFWTLFPPAFAFNAALMAANIIKLVGIGLILFGSIFLL